MRTVYVLSDNQVMFQFIIVALLIIVCLVLLGITKFIDWKRSRK